MFLRKLPCPSKIVYWKNEFAVMTQIYLLLSITAELRHVVYACGKCMRCQSQLDQTKVSNQGKNNIAFWIEIFLFKNWKRTRQKVETACVNAPLGTNQKIVA